VQVVQGFLDVVLRAPQVVVHRPPHRPIAPEG
jgi:hypothetical protein